MDYDPNEANRTLINIDLMIGSFIVKGKLHISTQADLATTIEVAHFAWLFMYDADVSNPYLPQVPVMHVPMLLVSPLHVSFGC